MGSFQTPITIAQAVRRITAHELLLPSFQREFVWKPLQIENLFDSLMRGYPISSMLFWKVKGEAKAKYKFYGFLTDYVERHKTVGSPFPSESINDFDAVLDGQQRLTALYIGLCGTYAFHRARYLWKYSEESFPPRILYLNISNELPEDENEKKYEFSFLEEKDTNADSLWTDAKGQKWFKVGEVLRFGDLKADYDLDDFASEFNLSKEEKKRIGRLEKVVFNETMINFYEEDDSSPERAVNIFVRINSGGTHLSLSDILFSIVTANWNKDAKKLIPDLVEAVNAMDFNITQDFVLRAFLMLHGREVRFKIKNFTNEFVRQLEENWMDIKTAIIELFRLMKSFGLTGFSLTSYNATLPILFYLYHSGIFKDFSVKVQFKGEREVMKRWLLKSLLLQTFGASADTLLQKARSVMSGPAKKSELALNENLDYFPDKDLERVLGQQTLFTDEELDNILVSTQKGSKYSFTVLALLFPSLNYADRKFHQDHLHPISAFDNDPDNRYIANSVLNLQMLEGNENKSKNAKSLVKWVEKEVDNGRSRDQVLADALIPIGVSLDIKDFQDFIDGRKTLLRNALRDSLGMQRSL